MQRLNQSYALLFGAVLAVALVFALFPFFPRQLRVQEGDLASRTIRAPKAASFESALLTEQARAEAAQAVSDVLAFDPNVRAQQLVKLDDALTRIGQVRDDDSLDMAAQRAQLLTVEGLGDARDSIDTILSLDNERWQAVASEADRLLESRLSDSIADDQVEDARDGLSSGISPSLSADEADVVSDLARPLVTPTLILDEEATAQARDEAKESVEPVRQSIAASQVIVEANQPIDATSIEVLRHVGLLTPVVQWDEVVAAAIVALLAAVVLTAYIWLFPARAMTSPRRLLLLALMVGAAVFAGRFYFSLVLPEESRRFLAYFLPLAAVPMLLAALLQTRLAIVVGLVQAVLLTFVVVSLPDLSLAATVEPLDAARVLLVYGLCSVLGAFAAHQAERPNQYVLGGALVGLAAFAALVATWLLDQDREAIDMLWMAAAATMAGLGSGVLTAGALTTVGALLGVTTRMQLMELAQLNSPLLRQLQDRAPGTFHHSVIVGNLAERAADLIGADALLVRVGCYYHDIGKIAQPGYYIENQLGGRNPHDSLDPRESAGIIARHVRNGLELARKHGLPVRVQAFIPEHHGTRLIPFFYRRASERDPNVDPSQFRYPGPKPRSRETAIVMLADSTEAMVRASADRSPEHIDAVVEQIQAERLAEGELEECDLTLRDLRTIAESFKQTLRGVYHPRIEYPEPTEHERRALIGRFRPGRQPPLPRSPQSPARGRRPS